MPRFALALALLLFLQAESALAEIYRWTDAQGQLHFTEDLNQVPPDQREQARKRPPADRPDALQLYVPPARPAPSQGTRTGAAIQIPFQREGTVMWVEAVVNERHRVPFLIDTGASGVSIPADVVRRIGIPVRSDTPRVTVSTANGMVRYPLVKVDSIQLGAARVNGLEATVNPTMNIGLLGGSFFNNYRYSVDTAASVITLVPNEGVRAGEAADQWRARFREILRSIERLETYLAEREITRSSQRVELETNLLELRDELRQLEIEANHAGVPKSWRR
jgi:clan AA aspartic protease (TIGR02281 family)